MTISESMYSFLKDYIKWVENGAVEKAPYCRADGLCFNIAKCPFNFDIWALKKRTQNSFLWRGSKHTFSFWERKLLHSCCRLCPT